jgi:N-acetyl-anhydromuramyl-L-alanine amidase AmpD
LVVLHSVEGDGPARAVAQWFAGPGSPQASAHYVVDADEAICCVAEGDTAWGAPGANEAGIHIEIVGWARWTEDEWRASGVLPRVIDLVRDVCVRHDLPVEHVDAAGLHANGRGVTRHRDVSEAFRRSTHTDPGVGFPLAWVLEQVRGPA